MCTILALPQWFRRVEGWEETSATHKADACARPATPAWRRAAAAGGRSAAMHTWLRPRPHCAKQKTTPATMAGACAYCSEALRSTYESAATAWSAAQARQRRSGPVCPALSSGPAPLALPPRLAAVQAVRAVAAVLRCSARQAGGASTRGASATVMLAAAGGWALCAPSLALTPQPPPLLFHSGSAAWRGRRTDPSPALTQAIALCKWSPTAHWAVAAG